jgi:hypothetical protein
MHEIAGFAGVAFYLGSYAILQLGLISGRGYVYAFLNLIAASLVLLSLFGAWNLFSAIIQVSWITISVFGMGRVFLMNHATRFTSEEEDVIASLLSGLNRFNCRKVLRLGHWVDAEPGMELTREGEKVAHLCWIAEGHVDVSMNGRKIAGMTSGSIVGEATCLSDAPATATTHVATPARLFLIPSDKLRRLAEFDDDIMRQLQNSFSAHLRDKLVASNHASAAGAHG